MLSDISDTIGGRLMFRRVLAVAAVLTACGVGFGQATDPKPDPEREKQLAEQRKFLEELRKRAAEAAEKYWKANATEVPDVVADTKKSFEPPKVEIDKADSPVVKASKRALEAERVAIRLIEQRIIAGQFQGGSAYVQMTNAAAGMFACAQDIWDDPEKLLPFAEFQLSVLAKAEAFNVPRVEQGVEEPQLAPQLRAARCKAEVVVLQLREKVKKK